MAKKAKAEEKDVVVVGAGVAGYKAAQDLAQLGLDVLLLEERPHAGGALAQHDRWFTTDDCSWCKTLPLFAGDAIQERCLRRQLDQPGIEIATAARLGRVAGERGHFTVTLEQDVDIVDPGLCTACDACAQVCPVDVPDEFEEGVLARNAAYIRHPWAVPGTYTIDLATCIRCGECEKACPTGAIDFAREGKTRLRTVNAKAVVLAPGFTGFDPSSMPQYHHGDHPDIYTNAEFERHLSGATGLTRRADGRPMRRIALLHCIGSRDEERDYCSSACCLIAAKEARMVRELDPEAEVTMFYMDMRDHVRDGHGYIRRALGAGVRLVRSRPPSIEVDPDGSLVLEYADATEGLMSEAFDAVVLQTAQVPPPGMGSLAEAAGVELDQHGFIARRPGVATETTREGVFVAGSAGGPKDIADTVTEAAAAAMEAALVAGVVKEDAPEASACPAQGKAPSVAVLVCRCQGELERTVDLEPVLSFTERLPHVDHVEAIDLVCKGGGDGPGIAEALEGKDVNRLVIAACPDYQWGRSAVAAAEATGVQRDLVEFVDLREWLAWPNPAGDDATAKARSLIAMATERLRTAVPHAPATVDVAQPGRALVIGGGVAGMCAALDLAAAGFGADIVERSEKLGGNILDLPVTGRGADAKHLLEDMVTRVEASKAIEVHRNHEVSAVDGAVGAFRVTLRDSKGEAERTGVYGAIILATGAARFRPKEYGMGKLEGVMDQFGLEPLIGTKDAPERVVMIQCAGSREEGALEYCSRVCCVRAIHNARRLKERHPEAEVTVLNRDIVTYGALEGFYTRARDEGIRFVRFAEDAKPVVREGSDGALEVEVTDPGLGDRLVLEADAVVLSAGMVPRPLGKLPELLRTVVDAHGFLASPSTKFRPVDAFRDGVYACGLCTGPKIAEESMASAHAAAARALTVLRRAALRARVGISTVNLRTCSACGLCVSQCPFQARYLHPKDGKARVDEAACWGCGVCAQVCPNGAASIATRSERQAIHQVDAAAWHA